MAQATDDGNGSNRKQKNLNLSAEASEWIEQQAQQKYGSKQKQGQVIEDLIAEKREEQSVKDEITEIKMMLRGALSEGAPIASERVSDTKRNYGGGENSGADESEQLSEAERMEQAAKNGEAIHPSEWDVSAAKGAHGIDRRRIILGMMASNETREATDKEAVRDMIREHMGYSKQGARELADDAMQQLDPHPLRDVENEWLHERIDMEASGKIQRQNPHMSSPKQYRRELGGSIEDYTGAAGLPTENVYAPDEVERMAEDVWSAYERLRDRYVNPANRFERKRIGWAMKPYLSMIDADVARVEIGETPLVELIGENVEEVFDNLDGHSARALMIPGYHEE